MAEERTRGFYTFKTGKMRNLITTEKREMYFITIKIKIRFRVSHLEDDKYSLNPDRLD